MDASTSSRYWCHKCNQQINPIIEFEVKCPNCNDTFVEECEPQQHNNENDSPLPTNPLLDMLTGTLRRRRSRPTQSDTEPESEDANSGNEERASIIQEVIQSMEERLRLEPNGSGGRVRHAIFLSPSGGHAFIVRGVDNGDHDHARVGGALGDYFIGPGFEDLMERLAESDPNRYGTPPAEKLAVEGMPRVKVEEGGSTCSVCLEEMEVGTEGRMMPCKHLFHGECILPWLELHSSCPVCRFQMPAQEVKRSSASDVVEREESGGRRVMMMAWPFGGLFGRDGAGDNGAS